MIFLLLQRVMHRKPKNSFEKKTAKKKKNTQKSDLSNTFSSQTIKASSKMSWKVTQPCGCSFTLEMFKFIPWKQILSTQLSPAISSIWQVTSPGEGLRFVCFTGFFSKEKNGVWGILWKMWFWTWWLSFFNKNVSMRYKLFRNIETSLLINPFLLRLPLGVAVAEQP